jgi:hypothetical protein
MLSTHLRLGLPSFLFQLFTKILYAFLFACIHVTCPTNLILLYVFLLIIFGEDCKSRSPTLCSFLTLLSLHPSSVQIFSSEPCSRRPSVYIIVIFGKASPFWSTTLLRIFWKLCRPVFASLDFAAKLFYRARPSALHPTPTWRIISLYLYHPVSPVYIPPLISESKFPSVYNHRQFYSLCSLITGHAVATSWKDAGSISDEVIGFFSSPNAFSRTAVLGSTKCVPGIFVGVKGGRRMCKVADFLENVGASTSHNHTGLQGLLQG